MSGQAVSGHSMRKLAQQRPIGCARCGRRVKDGAGRRVAGALLCPRCAAKAEAR